MSRVEQINIEELREKEVPESYIEEITNGVRNRIEELERCICPECEGSVQLEKWPDFKCENGHITNCNFLKEEADESDQDVKCFFCGQIIVEEDDDVGGFVMPDGETEVPYCISEECQAKAEVFGLQIEPTPQKPKEKSRLTMRFNSKEWKAILENVASLVDEATFTADSEGLALRVMDPSHVAMIDLSISKAFFEDYEIEGKPDIAFEVNQMLIFFKRSGKDEIAELDYNSDTEKIHLSTRNKKWARSYDLKNLESFDEEVPAPKITFNATLKVASKTLRDSISDLQPISDHVTLTATENDKLRLQSKGDWGTMTYDLDKTSEDILSFESKEKEVKAMFSFSYISEMTKQGNLLSDIATVEFSTDMPIRLTYNLNAGKLEYYLAPRIESD